MRAIDGYGFAAIGVSVNSRNAVVVLPNQNEKGFDVIDGVEGSDARKGRPRTRPGRVALDGSSKIECRRKPREACGTA